MMKKTFLCVLGIGAMMMLQSCFVQNVSVGMSESQPAQQVAKVKNHYFLWGLIQPKNYEAKNFVKNDKQFRMQTKTTFWDGFLQALTSGIYTPTTTYFYEPAK